MKILVCINQVPDTTSQINFTADHKSFDPTGVQFVINPSDEAALIRAIQLKEQEGAHITLVHVGLSDSEPVLRKAFALGADEMIRIDTFPTDGYFVAQQLAVVAKDYPIIFCVVVSKNCCTFALQRYAKSGLKKRKECHFIFFQASPCVIPERYRLHRLVEFINRKTALRFNRCAFLSLVCAVRLFNVHLSLTYMKCGDR